MIDQQASADQEATIRSSLAAGHQPLKHTQRFRRAANAVRLTPDQLRRQAGAMSAGWQVLGSRDAMLSFFNLHSQALGGRPIDIAIDSDAGLELVVVTLHRMAVDGDEIAQRGDQ